MKTLHLQLKRFVPVTVITLLLLLVVEIVFRGGGWFYDFHGWESPGLGKKMEKAEELFREKKRIDLVTLSTSVGRVWDVHQWEEATSGSLVAYNFGFPDQRPERQNFLFQTLIHPRYKPTHVIYGISIPDANSNVRGKHPDHPRDGPFWTYRRTRALAADNFLESGLSEMENFSHLFRSRKRARFTLQYGEIWMLPEDPTIGRGVIVPTVRQQPFGPMVKSWALDPLGLPNNTYHNYWAPDNGEFGEILALSKYCRKHDIEMVVVEVPTSPYSHTNFDRPEDYTRFTEALNNIANRGVWVLPMARELQLDNTYFEDQEHLNRWGGDLVTNYVYERVIRKWFPEHTVAASLPQPVQINISEQASEAEGLRVERLDPATAEAQYAAPEQVIVTRPADVLLTASLAAGSYAVELYAGDGSTTTPELTGTARLELVGLDAAGEVIYQFPLDQWINSRVGISYTQAHITVPECDRLLVRVAGVEAEHPVILDSAFIRPRLANLGDGLLVE